MRWPTACRCCHATGSATRPRRWARPGSTSGATATCSAHRASSWPRPARTPPCWCARSTWRAASTCAGSGRSCVTAGSTPTATCSSATSTEDPMTQTETPPATAPATLLHGQPLRVVERDGVRYTLLGTAHVSRASVDAVRAAVASGDYDAVAVELDPGRLQSLSDPDVLSRMDIMRVLREGKTHRFAANLAMARYQRRLAEQLDVEHGAEVKDAVEESRARGLPVRLIDREVGLTFRRAMQRLGWWGRAKTGAGIMVAMFGDEEVGDEEIEKLKQGDMLEASFGEFATHSPALYEAVIAERD